MTKPLTLLVVLFVQVVTATFFVGEIMISVFGIATRPIDWELYEWIELGAAVGLLLGVVLGGLALRESLKRTKRAESILAGVSGAFMDLVNDYFCEWSLTPAERDVALCLIKGLSASEIAALRGTSEGTVKAQSYAIYRKADVANRAQLVSLLIDDLMQDMPVPATVEVPEPEPKVMHG